MSFGTRHTLSDTISDTRGIGAARRWLKSELEAYGRASPRTGSAAMQVSFESHVQPADGKRVPHDTEIVNVMAVLPGTMPEASARRYYVVAHYDSRALDVLDATSDAPGANDDGSGAALVLELARVMAKRTFDATIVFLLTAGEEQGLFGARARAQAARESGEDVRAVLNDDIVGDPSSLTGGPPSARVRVFSEGLPERLGPEALAEVRSLSAESDSPSRELARYVLEVAGWEALAIQPVLVFRPDRFLRGGDHLAFNEAGFAAIRFTTVDETYERQHQNVRSLNGVAYGDLPEYVNAGYLAGVVRLNLATLAHLANAPSVPRDARAVTADLGHDAVLRWSPSPEPDVAGYEVVWRDTTSPVWQGLLNAGRATTATVPLSKDDHFFGVRAYDAVGYRSSVAFARAAGR